MGARGAVPVVPEALRHPDAGGSRRLAATLERYGEAIEADLAFQGISLVDLWNGRRWRFLLNLIDHLPANSYYVEARLNDDEFAEAVLEVMDDEAPPVPRARISEFSPLVQSLADIHDRLGLIAQAIIASGGGKPPKFRPATRPETAIDRKRREKRQHAHRALVALVLPDANTPT